MNVQLPLYMEKEAFLAWAEGREGRYELDGGRVIMMTGGSRSHWRITFNILKALDARVDPGAWEILADFGVDVGPDTIRYPDIVVDRPSESPRGRLAAIAPVLIIEVLSPSTEGIDLNVKAAEYLRLPSLAAYLVFTQDALKARAWVRGEAGFPPEPHVFTAREDMIRVDVLGLTLPLADVYARVKVG
jgi:Uma2 family endonuclease